MEFSELHGELYNSCSPLQHPLLGRQDFDEEEDAREETERGSSVDCIDRSFVTSKSRGDEAAVTRLRLLRRTLIVRGCPPIMIEVYSRSSDK